MKLNPFVQAGIGLTFALLWSCPTLAALTEANNFGLEVKVTGQSEDDRDLGTQKGGDVNGIGLKGSPTWVSRIFSPERALGEIVGDGAHDPEGAADLLIRKMLEKDLLAL